MLDFLGLKKSVESISEQIHELAETIETKKQQREDLQTLPVPVDDAIDRLHRWIDVCADQHIDGYYSHKAAQIFGPDSIHLDRIQGAGPLLLGNHSGGGNADAHALLFILRDQIKQGVADMVKRLPQPERVGPPLAERGPLIKKLDAEITKLESKMTELLQSADAAGIRIERLKPSRANHPDLYKGGKPLST